MDCGEIFTIGHLNHLATALNHPQTSSSDNPKELGPTPAALAYKKNELIINSKTPEPKRE